MLLRKAVGRSWNNSSLSRIPGCLARKISLARSAGALNGGKVFVAGVPYVVPARDGRGSDHEIHGRGTLAASREASPEFTRVHADIPRKINHLQCPQTFNRGPTGGALGLQPGEQFG